MKYSVAFASETDSWKWVKRAEALGYHTAWFYDTQLLNPDIFICMALAAHETSEIRLGTGVIVPSNRIEPVTANALASLNKIASGRIDFGVGTGFTARRTMGLGAMTLASTKQYIERVQQLLAGETVEWDFEDKTRKIAFLNPELELIDIEHEVPIWFSAFGPKSKQVAAELEAGWLNFGIQDTGPALEEMTRHWSEAGHDPASLKSNLFVLGAVLGGKEDDQKLMAQGGPQTAVIFHNLADESGPMGGKGVNSGPLSNLVAEYMQKHDQYEPVDAKYLQNHKGHLMFVREEETHITPELVKATTLSGTHDELVNRIKAIADQGYSQITVQVVHNHESAIEEWAEVFKAAGCEARQETA